MLLAVRFQLAARLLLSTAAALCGCKSADGGGNLQPTPSKAPSTPVEHQAASATTAAPATSTNQPEADLAPSSSAPGVAASSAIREKVAYRIAAVGDSLTDPRSHGGGFLRFVRQRCPETRIDNFATGGHMLNQIRRSFEDKVHNQPHGSYTHVVVWGGVNDLYSDLTAGRTPAKAATDLSFIYKKARNKGAKVVAFTVSPWGGFERYHNSRRQKYTEELNDWIRSQREAGTVDHVVDAYKLLSCGNPELLCPRFTQRVSDGLHIGKEGHQVLGQALYERVFQNCR